MKKNNGFTLIELVVVIVILGILSAVAAPKFMDLQSDARISAINGLAGTIKSAVNMGFAKSIIQGSDKVAVYCGSVAAAQCATADVSETHVIYGIPAASKNGILFALQDESSFGTLTEFGACDSSADWCFYPSTDDETSVYFAPKSSAGITGANGSDSCGLKYTVTPDANAKTAKYTVTSFTSGC